MLQGVLHCVKHNRLHKINDGHIIVYLFCLPSVNFFPLFWMWAKKMLLWCGNVQCLNTSELWQARPIVSGSVVPCSLPANEVWGKVIFLQMSVILFMAGRACMVAGGTCMVARGVCMVAGEVCMVAGGMHGCQGVCMVAGGHAWLLGGCVVAGGHTWLVGACMVAGGHAWLQGGMHG